MGTLSIGAWRLERIDRRRLDEKDYCGTSYSIKMMQKQTIEIEKGGRSNEENFCLCVDVGDVPIPLCL